MAGTSAVVMKPFVVPPGAFDSLPRALPLILAATGMLAALPGGAAGYPDKPMRLVVGYPPGGANDLVGRHVARKLNEFLNSPVVVDNRAGANGIIGCELVAKSAPDGYTLLFAGMTPLVLNPLTFAKLPYKTLADFTAITTVASGPVVIAVHPGVQANTVQELIALARKKPGSLDYASSGNGTTTHLAGELFKMRTGVDIVHVPYKGSSAAIQDLVAGRISIMFENLPIGLKWVTAGRLIPLAVTGITRSPALPDVPTMQESGVADFNVTGWSGVFAPAATPPAIVAQIAESISEVMGVPAMREAFNANGAEVVASTPEQFSRQIKAEMAGWISVVRASGAKVD